MADWTLIIEDEKGLRALAAHLAPLLKTGDTVTLAGDLGTGKTAFARALIQALSPLPEEVPSPTFTLVQVYDLPRIVIWHFDLYRLEEARDIESLALEDALAEPAVVLIEWPERFSLHTDWPKIKVQLEHLEGDTRRITISGSS